MLGLEHLHRVSRSAAEDYTAIKAAVHFYMPNHEYDYPIISSSSGIKHNQFLKLGGQFLQYRFAREDGRSMVVKYDYRALLSIAQENVRAGRQPDSFTDDVLRSAQWIANLHNGRLEELREFFRTRVPYGYAESVILEVSGELIQRLTISREFQRLFDPESTYAVPTVAHYQEHIPELANQDTLWFQFGFPELMDLNHLEPTSSQDFLRNYQTANGLQHQTIRPNNYGELSWKRCKDLAH
jgi:hypothetical protein